jgi:hypothetical protein
MIIGSQAVALAAAGIIALGLATPAFAKQKNAQMQMQAPGQPPQMMSGNPSRMQAPGQPPQMMSSGPGNPSGSGVMAPGLNGSSRPPGWGHGVKRGWGGHNMPPGQYKKQFR